MNLDLKREAIKNNYFLFKMLLFAILFFTVEIFPQLSSPYYQWVKNAGSTNFDRSFCATVDNQGNIIVSGYCDSVANFGGIIVPNFGQSDIVIAKYNQNGNIIWAKNAGGPNNDGAYGVIVDHENNIIVTGYFYGSATFDTITVQATGMQDIFIAKYNPDGHILWLGYTGGVEAFDDGYGVAVDDQDNLILTGQMFGEIYINDTTSLVGGANSNIFLIKGDKNGNLKWARTTTGDGYYNAGYGISTDKNNNIYLCGTFGDTATFSSTTLTSAGGSDIFIAKVDPNGNLIWVKQAGGPYYDDIAYDIKVGNDGMLYLTGGFGSTATFGNISLTSNGIEDIFIAKYDTSGNPIWVRQEGQANGNLGTGIAVDKGNNVSIIGMYNQLIGSSPNQISEVYIGRFNSDGIKSWQSIINSSGISYSGGIAVSDSGDLFFSGAFSGTGVFGNISLNSFNSSEDIFTGSIQAPHLHTQRSLIFSSGQVGGTYYSTFSIINQSKTKLYIRNYKIVGKDSADFSLNQTTLADSINGNQFANIGVNYSPFNNGEKQAYLIISSDSPSNPDTVYLQGMTSVISLSSDTLNFGTIDLNNSANKNLTISNLNTLSNLVINLSISGSDSSEFSLSSLQDSIPSLGSANVNVTFTPQTEGNKFAVINIYDTSAVKLDSVILIGIGKQAITVQYGDTATLYHNTILNINPPPGFVPDSNKFFYKKAEDGNYYQDFLVKYDTSFVGIIPSLYSTVTGVEYYIVFYSATDSITYPFINPVNNPAAVVLKIPSYLYPTGINKAVYQMISIPLNLRNPNILSVLSDYGTYDNRFWRILRWQPELNNYIEYPELTNKFTPGNAFWLIRRDGKKFTIRNALTMNPSETYPITVHPGWNQVGDPFAFPVSWDSIGNSGLLQLPIFWNPDIQDYQINQAILEPWTGYWVYNSESTDVTLVVRPIAQTSVPKRNKITDLNKDEFYIQIEGSIKNTNIIDRQNFVGMFEQNRIILNKSDVLAPPSITGSLDLNIVKNKRNYAQSIVPVSSEGAYWDLSITSNSENKDVVIQFNSESALPKDFDIWFFDMDRQTAIPVVNNSVELQLPPEGLKNCRIIVGKEDYAKSHSNNIPLVPLDYALLQNYPNPFNPTTNIIYQLREKSNVTLEIFDVLGRRIVSLINNQVQSAGRHTIIWNGKNSSGIKAASGVYLYRIRANNFVDTKKMVLLR